jgi:hypothetical protein
MSPWVSGQSLTPSTLNNTIPSWYSGAVGVYAAVAYGVVADGVTVNTVALQNAISAASNAGGGIVLLPEGRIRTGSVRVQGSNVVVQGVGAGTVLSFMSGNPSTASDRCITVNSDARIAGPYSVTGSIQTGAMTFAVPSGDADDIVAGTWLFMYETDAIIGDIIACDWVQVQSASGLTVNCFAPFRTAFPALHQGTKYVRTVPIENCVFKDFAVESADTTQSNVNVQFGIPAKDCRCENVISSTSDGNAFYAYRTKNLTIQNCQQKQGHTQASEFAACLDLKVLGSHFGSEGQLPDTAALTLDMATAFFRVANNEFGGANNIALQVLYGVHDGVVSGNLIPPDSGSSLGISILGSQRVVFANNVLVGAGGATGIGSGSATATPNILSKENVYLNNVVTGYTAPYSLASQDLSLAPNVATGGWTIDVNAALKDAILMRDLSGTENNWGFGPGVGAGGSFGFYNRTANALGFKVTNAGTAFAARSFAGPDGSAIVPSMAYISEESLGFYRSAASTLRQSYGTIDFSQANLSIKTTGTSLTSLTVPQGGFALFVGGTSGATLAARSGGTLYFFASSSSTVG